MANEMKFGNKVVFLNGNPLTLPVRAADPGSAVAGDMYYNSTSNSPKYYNGSSWVSFGATYTADGNGIELSGNEFSLELDSSTLSKSASGLKVADGGISNAQVNASAGIVYSKLSIADGDLSIAKTSGLQSALDGKVDENAPIVGATKTKITYDAKGLVTAGADAAIADITGLQDALDDKIDSSEKGANNGVATLDAGGKIPASQLPNSVMEYKGNWNASTNSPTLADGTGNAGDVYRVSVAGSQDLGSGSISFGVGDWVVYSGSIWEKSSNSDAVVSVNSQTGIVSLDSDDIAEGSSNLYFSDERAQDAVGLMVDDSAKVSLTYTDGTPSLVADIVAGSLVNADISASAAIAYSKLNLASSIVNADISASAAIVYSKLSIADGDLSIAKTSGLQSALDGKVDENAAIVGATKTKITYDAKGLVTAGADLAASDLPTGIDAAKIADGSVSNAEFQFLNSVTSNVQDQLDSKIGDDLAQGSVFVGDAGGLTSQVDTLAQGDIQASPTGFNIKSGVIVNADVNASAAIAESKLALDYSTSSLNTAIGTKANDADVIKKDGSVAFTGDQSMGGNDLTDATRLQLTAPKVGRSQDGSNFIEEQYVDSVTLTASSTVNAATYAAASYVGVHVEYMIKTNAGEIRTGKVYLANKSDGSSVSMSDQFSETADCEVILSADFSTPNIRLRAQNLNAAAATMRLDIKLIRA
jgi:hypothetical protein